MCREDIKRQNNLGNIWEHGLEEIWERGSKAYKKHLEAEYPPLCRDCDEYYTYNF
jgi:radical SAM protein with 4Fe4S-binding SPASM domain